LSCVYLTARRDSERFECANPHRQARGRIVKPRPFRAVVSHRQCTAHLLQKHDYLLAKFKDVFFNDVATDDGSIGTPEILGVLNFRREPVTPQWGVG
jgi:hypothetical protein